MEPFLRGYHVSEPTWFYLSFLLIIAVFFKFGRLWSVRNLDLLLLLTISPGLLFLADQPAAGYVWLFVTTGLLLSRVLLDALFTRRPRLEQNMNVAGMTFLLAAAFAFLMTKVMTEPPPQATVESVRRTNQMLQRQPEPPRTTAESTRTEAGPGLSLLVAPVAGISSVVARTEESTSASHSEFEINTARSIAIIAHLAVILGLIFVGKVIFADLETGLAMATIYLLLPCTAYDVGKVNHVLPSALIVWAICAYRHPLISGSLLGLASGTLFFPVFLLPLWASFYGRRGAIRFGVAVTSVTAVIVASLLLTSGDTQTFLRQTIGYIEWARLQFRVTDAAAGFWSDHESAYRVPVFVGFMVMLVALTIWPRQKGLRHVMAQSAAIIVGTQFWYPQQGGVYVLWYLPLLLLVVFRPALANHVAPELKPFDWLRIRKPHEQPKAELVA